MNPRNRWALPGQRAHGRDRGEAEQVGGFLCDGLFMTLSLILPLAVVAWLTTKTLPPCPAPRFCLEKPWMKKTPLSRPSARSAGRVWPKAG
jgi:hypothetical protein